MKEQLHYIGCSGWNYNHWAGIFYPKDIPKSKWLQYYSNVFDTVEINATFYRQFKDCVYINWYNKVPDNFCFSVKMSKYITHIKRLDNVSAEIHSCIASALLLKEKLGVILIQLPPSLKFDTALVADFVSALPSNYRYTIEARHSSWLCDSSFSLLQQYNVAWCISDTAGRYPYHEEITADFVYIRLHGSTKLYTSNYTDKELHDWAEKIISWNRLTYCYFDNDFNAYAAFNALTLKKILLLANPSQCTDYML
ncbi:MAG: DUF72 domain-containing protein [Spirochaetes bacterium]|nr:DUF72 domain-containing protein [Spirochaetota bacterium]